MEGETTARSSAARFGIRYSDSYQSFYISNVHKISLITVREGNGRVGRLENTATLGSWDLVGLKACLAAKFIIRVQVIQQSAVLPLAPHMILDIYRATHPALTFCCKPPARLGK